MRAAEVAGVVAQGAVVRAPGAAGALLFAVVFDALTAGCFYSQGRRAHGHRALRGHTGRAGMRPRSGQRRCSAAVPVRRGHGCASARHGGQSGALVPGGWCAAMGKGADVLVSHYSMVWRVY